MDFLTRQDASLTMKITLHKTSKGVIQILVQFPYLEVSIPLKIIEARELAKQLADLVSPQRTFTLLINDEDGDPQDGTYVEASSRALAVHRIVEGATCKISFLADDTLFDMKKEFDRAFEKILGQDKKVLNLGALPPHLSGKQSASDHDGEGSDENPLRGSLPFPFRMVPWCCTIQP